MRWSYGVLVYEMLVGKSPFNDADVAGTQHLRMRKAVSMNLTLWQTGELVDKYGKSPFLMGK